MTPRSPSRPVRTLVLVAALLLAATACGGGDASGDGDDTTTAVPTTTATPPTTSDQDGGMNDSTTTPPGSMPPGSQVDQAVADLADRLGIDPGAITVVSHEGVTWPDGSLGCPQPGMGYTQALVDGTRTVLEVDGQTYSYHAAGMGPPFLCDNPQPGVGET